MGFDVINLCGIFILNARLKIRKCNRFQCIKKGYSMSSLCRKMFPKKVSYSLWIMAEIAIIGADI